MRLESYIRDIQLKVYKKIFRRLINKMFYFFKSQIYH